MLILYLHHDKRYESVSLSLVIFIIPEIVRHRAGALFVGCDS